ncbi:MAG: thioredoxin-disulfide reductase [Candidatus Sumerlaeia bacterium]|nr:thioredoxin-disulfide reductase [Candidatus Sumerlaeia bacterium]
MADSKIRNILICGSGPAGLTAAIYTARANLAPLLLAGPQVGGQLTTTTTIENFPGFPKGQDGNQLMIDMEEQARHNGAEILYEKASSLAREGDHYVLETGAGTLRAYAVIVATGASPRLMGLPSEQTYWNYGVHTCAVCDGGFYKGKSVAVVGGGDSAMEEATYLAKLCEKVHLIHRRDEFRASQVMAERTLGTKNIVVEWNSVVDEVLGEQESERKKRVTSIRLKSTKDGSTREIPASAMFLAIGHTPNSDWFAGVLKTTDSGYLIVDEHLQTNLPGVFGAGDIHDHHYRQAITAAGYGCQAALEAERYLVRNGLAG